MRNFTAVATAFAASAVVLGLSAGASAQTWVETHPALIDASSRVRVQDVQAQSKADEALTTYREARLRPDDESKPADSTKADGGSLDHPANATSESHRHE